MAAVARIFGCAAEERCGKAATVRYRISSVIMDLLIKTINFRIKLGERLSLDDLCADEQLAPLDRLYEATCPPIGTPLSALIAVELFWHLLLHRR